MSNFLLAAPLFALVLAGYLLVAVFGVPKRISDLVAKLVFSVAIPALLFRMMSGLSELPPVDARLLLAFFGSCLLVFGIGRLVGWRLFALDGVSQSVFALAGVFSNNVLLGVPLATALLGPEALPAVSLVLVFNAFILWTLVTVSVEWARHGTPSLTGIARTVRNVLTNPVVASILSGTLFGLAGGNLPEPVDRPLELLGKASGPLSLLSLGMGLAEYGLRAGWRESVAISALKLVVMPLSVWVLARLLGLPLLETQVVVLLASLSVGVNVYLMAVQFEVMQGPVAGSMVFSTAAGALTTPLALALVELMA